MFKNLLKTCCGVFEKPVTISRVPLIAGRRKGGKGMDESQNVPTIKKNQQLI